MDYSESINYLLPVHLCNKFDVEILGLVVSNIATDVITVCGVHFIDVRLTSEQI